MRDGHRWDLVSHQGHLPKWIGGRLCELYAELTEILILIRASQSVAEEKPDHCRG